MNPDELKVKAEEYLSLERHPYFLEDLKKVIEKNDQNELNDRFYTDLGFGTGGLRGVIGGGYNRMNAYTVRKATQGLADYITEQKGGSGSVAIAYDSRNFSETFAKEAALTLCTNGIKVYLFSSLRPTPELSFAVRELGATAGIVVTASHNPPEYNGYKVYWEDGGQIVPPHDSSIIKKVREVSKVPESISEKDALEKGLLVYIDSEIDDKFISMIKKYFLYPELLKEKGKDLKVVYTPLHGTGTMLVERTLSEIGIEVVTVPEQREPDGNFPTVDYPNPEEASAMKLACELGEKIGADLVLGTDPDADRLGIAVPGKDGKMQLITGNQLGSLLSEYRFSGLKEKDAVPSNPVLIKTIVTTELQARIAAAYGAKVYNVLTGFKYIGEKLREFESTGENYVFGGEESYGYLTETEVRDKDAVSSAVLTAEMALVYREKGMSLLDLLDDIYSKYGYFEETMVSKTYKGQQGVEKIKSIMTGLRENPPSKIGDSSVTLIKDYQNSTEYDGAGKESGKINLPVSNVLQYILADDTIVTARPSGTEPKIKFYASVCTEKGIAKSDAIKIAGTKIDAIKADIEKICG